MPSKPVNPPAKVEQSTLLENILESSTEYSIVGKDLSGNIEFWNSGARLLYGYGPEEVIGNNSEMLYTPGDVASGRPGEIMDAVLKVGKWEGTLTRVRKSGDRFTARIVVTLRRNAGDEPIGFLLISKDMADEIRLTEERRATQFYARSLIEASLDPLVTISAEGKITDVNEGSIKITGIAREMLIGTDFSDYFTEPEKAREGYLQVFSMGQVTDYPLTIRHKDGHLIDVLYNASVYKDALDNVLGVFAAARDVTARKRAEAELAEQRTKEMERIAELERFQKLTVGRELKMIELKKDIEELKKQIDHNKIPD